MKDNKRNVFVLSAIIVVLLISLFFIFSKDKNGKNIENEKGNGVNTSEFIEDEFKDQNIQDRDYTEQDELVFNAMVAETNVDKEKMLSVFHEEAKEIFLLETKDSELWNKEKHLYSDKFEESVASYIFKRYDEGEKIYYQYDYTSLTTPSMPESSKFSGGNGYVELIEIDGKWYVDKLETVSFKVSDEAKKAMERSPDSIKEVVYNEDLYEYLPKNRNN